MVVPSVVGALAMVPRGLQWYPGAWNWKSDQNIAKIGSNG